MRRACARTLSPRSYLVLEHRLAHTQPALRTGLMAPAWRLLHISRGLILDLARLGLAWWMVDGRERGSWRFFFLSLSFLSIANKRRSAICDGLILAGLAHEV